MQNKHCRVRPVMLFGLSVLDLLHASQALFRHENLAWQLFLCPLVSWGQLTVPKASSVELARRAMLGAQGF